MTSLTGATTVDVPRGLVWSISELTRPTFWDTSWGLVGIDASRVSVYSSFG